MVNVNLVEFVLIFCLFGCSCAGCAENRLVSVGDPEPLDGSYFEADAGGYYHPDSFESDGGFEPEDTDGGSVEHGRDAGSTAPSRGIYRCLVNGHCVFCLPGDSTSQYCVNGDAG